MEQLFWSPTGLLKGLKAAENSHQGPGVGEVEQTDESRSAEGPETVERIWAVTAQTLRLAPGEQPPKWQAGLHDAAAGLIRGPSPSLHGPMGPRLPASAPASASSGVSASPGCLSHSCALKYLNKYIYRYPGTPTLPGEIKQLFLGRLCVQLLFGKYWLCVNQLYTTVLGEPVHSRRVGLQGTQRSAAGSSAPAPDAAAPCSQHTAARAALSLGPPRLWLQGGLNLSYLYVFWWGSSVSEMMGVWSCHAWTQA